MAQFDIGEKVRADVARFGWHVAKVFDSQQTLPPFAYSIGFERMNHPEVTIFGLNNDLEVMHQVLNDIGERIRQGERFEHGMTKEGILPGCVCSFARLPKSAYDSHIGQAVSFHGSRDFRAVQCLWPAPSLHMPWDPKVSLAMLERQPVFLRPDAGPVDPPWRFEQPQAWFVWISPEFARGEQPLRAVNRSGDEWEFRTDPSSPRESLIKATLGYVVDRDPGIDAVAMLETGQRSDRLAVGMPWVAT